MVDQEKSMHEIDPTQKIIEIEGRTIALSSWVQACDEARERHVLKVAFPWQGLEITESRSSKGGFNVKGHASVFDRTSLDLGGFREQVSHGFFQPVLDRSPDVHAVWDHDTRLTLARTRNSTLELREDDIGLYNFIKVAPTSYAQDLRILMERGDIDQQSFAFTVEDDRYEEDDTGNIMRTLIRARDLFDVTITAQGAYPQTSAEVTRSVRSLADLDRKFFAVSKVGDGAAASAYAVATPADGAVSTTPLPGAMTPDKRPNGDQAVSKTEQIEEQMRKKEAMIKKAAALASILAKQAERLEKLE